MILEVTAANGIAKEVFVKQRLRDPLTSTFQDVFAAVASPAQMEDLDINEPTPDTTFFRVKLVDIVGSSPTYLNDVFDSILVDAQKLISDTDTMADLIDEGNYIVTASAITPS